MSRLDRQLMRGHTTWTFQFPKPSGPSRKPRIIDMFRAGPVPTENRSPALGVSMVWSCSNKRPEYRMEIELG